MSIFQTPPTVWDIDIKREQARRTLTMQEDLLRFLKLIFGISFIVTLPTFISTIYLKAWSVGGFELSDEIIITLGGVTGSEIIGLISVSIKTFLRPI